MPNDATPTLPVLIAGAGPTGLLLALLLTRQGVPHRLISAASGPSRESRAMVVQARTLEYYRTLGIVDDFLAEGVPIRRFHIKAGGHETGQLRLDNLGDSSPYPMALALGQDVHEHLLLARLEAAGGRVEWNTRLAAVADAGGGVTVRLARGDIGGEGGEEVRVSWMCGCDGAHSVARHALGIGFPGGEYAQVFYVADVDIDAPQGVDLGFDDGMFSFDKSRFALLLPVRKGGTRRFIGVVPPDLADRENLAFADLQPLVEAMFGTRVRQTHWFATYRVHHRVAETFRRGRVLLAGDAGHIHSPAGGQGMNTGLGDAANLAWKLAMVVGGRAPAGLLDTYDSERRAFARTLVRSTDQAFRAIVDPGLFGELTRSVVPHLLPRLTDIDAFRRLFFSVISQTRLHYPDSPLSEGRAGGVQPGDRIPWAHWEGGDSFQGYDLAHWRAQVWGAEVPPDFARAAAGLGLGEVLTVPREASLDAGVAPGAAFLVRPDGYVALAMPRPYAERLGVYAQKHGLAFAA